MINDMLKKRKRSNATQIEAQTVESLEGKSHMQPVTKEAPADIHSLFGATSQNV